jgi:DNA-binding response OmpR family regulator
MPTLMALVADAEPDHREVVISALRGGGFLVVEPADEHDVLTATRERGPDLVLLDLKFAEGAGWRIIEALQGDSSTCDVPVIALSDQDLLTEADRLWKVGFCGYLKKPVSGTSLLAAVRYCLARTAEGADWVDLSGF